MGRRKSTGTKGKPDTATPSAKKARLLKGQEDPIPESSDKDDSVSVL